MRGPQAGRRKPRYRDEVRLKMTGERERATKPEDLTRLFVEMANAGDAEGLAALYEPRPWWRSRPGR
jgi:hypothetical protein